MTKLFFFFYFSLTSYISFLAISLTSSAVRLLFFAMLFILSVRDFICAGSVSTFSIRPRSSLLSLFSFCLNFLFSRFRFCESETGKLEDSKIWVYKTGP